MHNSQHFSASDAKILAPHQAQGCLVPHLKTGQKIEKRHKVRTLSHINFSDITDEPHKNCTISKETYIPICVFAAKNPENYIFETSFTLEAPTKTVLPFAENRADFAIKSPNKTAAYVENITSPIFLNVEDIAQKPTKSPPLKRMISTLAASMLLHVSAAALGILFFNQQILSPVQEEVIEVELVATTLTESAQSEQTVKALADQRLEAPSTQEAARQNPTPAPEISQTSPQEQTPVEEVRETKPHDPQDNFPILTVQKQSKPKPSIQPIQAVKKAAKKPEKPQPKPIKVASHTAENLRESAAMRAGQREQAEAKAAQRAGMARSYQGQVMAHLARHKNYPSTARAQGMEGRTVVHFTLSRSGQVISARLVGGSGAALLDQETLATVRRASPFPAMPSELGQSTQSFTAPLSYRLR
jgi:periplasmic protein TonB